MASVHIQARQGLRILSLQSGTSLRDCLLAAGFPLASRCGGNGSCGRCLVAVAESAAIPFTRAERARLTPQQLAAGVRLACQIQAGHLGLDTLHVSLLKPETTPRWRGLYEDEYLPLPPLPPRPGLPLPYGLAVDLGTTHIRLTLWNRAEAVRLDGRVGLNPQGSYGADVLNRVMAAAESAAVAEEMRSLTAQAIAEALAEMLQASALERAQIGQVTVVGNTAMLALLAGHNYELLMQPENWQRRIPVGPVDDLMRTSWGLAQACEIRLLPPLGGFIGSDLVAGVLACGMLEQPAPSLLIDFGTNSEIALWDGMRLSVTSTAGGPAFEGSGISCGMSAESGAIWHVQMQRGELRARVLGNGAARGLCGSGLVDVVALLLQHGKLDRVGRMHESLGPGLLLAEGEHRVQLLRADVDVLQRAKAAVAAGVTWLCAEAGIHAADLQAVFVCGAFGGLLNVTHAMQIGLLPTLPVERVHLAGNAALAGCERLLLAAQPQLLLDGIMARATVHNLAEDGVFEQMFVDNLYLQPMRF